MAPADGGEMAIAGAPFDLLLAGLTADDLFLHPVGASPAEASTATTPRSRRPPSPRRRLRVAAGVRGRRAAGWKKPLLDPVSHFPLSL